MHNNPKLIDKVADAIDKMQRLGYTVAFNKDTNKYEVCEDEEAKRVIQEFGIDQWEAIIEYADTLSGISSARNIKYRNR